MIPAKVYLGRNRSFAVGFDDFVTTGNVTPFSYVDWL